MTALRIDLVRTNGIFSLDGQDFEVENNVWIVGDDHEVLVIDAAHEAAPIAAGVAGRRTRMIVATHGHNDHINAALDLADMLDAPVALHPADAELWKAVHHDRGPDVDLADGDEIAVGDRSWSVIHTPGHSPGGVCLSGAVDGVLFSGDTLFRGGPGATGRSLSSFPVIIDSIRDRLLTLPARTAVYPGHGEGTTIGDEAPHLQEWIERGH